MNLRNTMALALAALASSVTVSKPDEFIDQHVGYDPANVRYDAGEWSVDVAGTLGSRDRENFSSVNALGLGLGVNYFITRNLGVGAETYMDELDWPNHFDFSALGRWPIEDTGFAPYVLGGFGRQFHDLGQWTAHVGGGIEYRWNGFTAVFFDLRQVFPATTPDFTLWRLGLRLRF